MGKGWGWKLKITKVSSSLLMISTQPTRKHIEAGLSSQLRKQTPVPPAPLISAVEVLGPVVLR